MLVFQSALVLVIYWPTRSLGFTSDAWVYLERLRHGAWASVATPVGYHWQPVACAWIALIRALFGERPAIFQTVNLAQLTALGYLTFQLGRRLLPDSGAAFLASLLVLGSASFYEATYWPLAGNMHLLAAGLYVLAVIIACEMARGRLAGSGPWLLGLTVLMAVFSHPAMVTSIPVCALTLVLLDDGSAGRHGRTGWLRALFPLAVVALLFAVARFAFAAYFEMAPKPGLDPDRAFWLVRRGLLGLFTLQGSPVLVDRMMTMGTHTEYGNVRMWFFVAFWLAAAALAGLCLWRARKPGLRVLVAFLGIHLVAVALASPLTPRQCVVPAVPAALLTVWAVRAGAQRLASGWATPAGAALCREIPAAFVLLLLVVAQTDHHTAAAVHKKAADASRNLADQIRAVAPPAAGPVALTLVNMPEIMMERGIAAFAFATGVVEMARLTSPMISTIDMYRMPIVGAPDYVVAVIPVMSPDALRAQLAEPRRTVLLFEKESPGARVLTVEDVGRLSFR